MRLFLPGQPGPVSRAHNLLTIQGNAHKIVSAPFKDIHPKPIVRVGREDDHAGGIATGPKRFDQIQPGTIRQITIGNMTSI